MTSSSSAAEAESGKAVGPPSPPPPLPFKDMFGRAAAGKQTISMNFDKSLRGEGRVRMFRIHIMYGRAFCLTGLPISGSHFGCYIW